MARHLFLLLLLFYLLKKKKKDLERQYSEFPPTGTLSLLCLTVCAALIQNEPIILPTVLNLHAVECP